MQTLQRIKTAVVQLWFAPEVREHKTKKYTRHMIKKYGKTLRKLSKE